MTLRSEFSSLDIQALAATMKMALVATLDGQGLPHVSLLTSLAAKDAHTLTIGEFCKGLSKTNMRRRPKVAFWVLDGARRVWRGKAIWQEARGEGPDYELYNQQPLFRYNAYFGINTVHYLNLVEIEGPKPLSLPRLVLPGLLSKALVSLAKGESRDERVMNAWTETFAKRLDVVKLAAIAHDDGFPRLFPLPAAQPTSDRSLLFSPFLAEPDAEQLRAGQTVALFLMSAQLENVLLRGEFLGYSRRYGVNTGELSIDWIYNSMPPAHGQIYPPLLPQAVERFE